MGMIKIFRIEWYLSYYKIEQLRVLVATFVAHEFLSRLLLA